MDTVQPNPQIALTPHELCITTTLCSYPRLIPLQHTTRPMHARHVVISSVFLFLLALCVVALFPSRNSPLPHSFFQLRLPPANRKGNTEEDNAGGNHQCDYSDGRWVRDDGAVVAYREDCPFLDPGFRCMGNGRRDSSFLRWRWQPHRCHLPK